MAAIPEGFTLESPATSAAIPEGFTIEAAPEESSFFDKAKGLGEAALAVGSSAIAEPIAGIAGLSSLQFGAERGGEAVEQVRESLTYQPESAEGRANLIALSKKLQPLTDILEKAETASGDLGYDIAGPIGGAIATALPTLGLELLGLGGVSRAKTIAKAVPEEKALGILEAGKAADVPILTTDVLPPKTYSGKFLQSINEKLGPLGSGKARASQQVAREEAVQGIADNFEVDLESDFASQIVSSLNKKSAKTLSDAGSIRRQAIDSLSEFGEVPLENTRTAIAEQLAKQEGLKGRGHPEIIKKLQDNLNALEGGDFRQMASIRSEVIADLIGTRKGEDLARAEPAYQAVKSAIDLDMSTFAKELDRTAAAKWETSNRQFATELNNIKRTELKRILNSGESTPEKVMPLLRGGKRSELQRLYGALDDKGRTAAKSAIIQDALKDSKFFELDADPNPNAFATAMNRPNRIQAVDIFFKGKDKKEIDGLVRMLNATRRAQEASAAPKTGELLTLPAIGTAGAGLTVSNPLVGIPAITAMSALAKAYESAPFRNLLLKINNTQKGSKAETGLLELAVPFVVEGLKVATKEQEEK